MKRKPKTDPVQTQTGYTVLARRYRPQLFSELVGQEPVAQALSSAIETNRVAHAYLFTGARGVGKTSAARILAKALNCEKGPTTEPCGQCEICQAIASGDDVDVLEIDGASNRGIDEVRAIRQNVQFRPSRSRHKIYIIDEVHMLSAPAFNALLKTLEEPPAHVKFIFATTEVQKIPITILSRCQRFDFAGIGTARISQRLTEIVANEGKKADAEALELVARRAGGSMRDAQSLLDQLLAFGGDCLTVEQVHQLLGTANDERVADLAAAVLERDAKRALELLAEAADQGLQLGEFVDQLMDYWRDLMVVNAAGGDGRELSVLGKHCDTLAQQAKALSLDTILAGMDVLVSCKARLRNTNHGRVLLEMTLVRLARLDSLVSLTQLAQWLGQTPDSMSLPAPTPPPRQLAPSLTAAANLASPTSSELPAVKKKPLNGTGETGTRPEPLTSDSLPQIWQRVISQVGGFLANSLSRAELPAISGPNTLVLRFSARYTLERERCQDPALIARIEEAIKQCTGQAVQLRIEAGGEDGGSSPAATSAAEPEPQPARARRHRTEALEVPLLKRAVDLLGAQVLHMDDGFGAESGARQDEAEAAEAEEL